MKRCGFPVGKGWDSLLAGGANVRKLDHRGHTICKCIKILDSVS